MLYALIDELKAKNVINLSCERDLHDMYNLLCNMDYELPIEEKEIDKKALYSIILARFFGFLDNENKLTLKGKSLLGREVDFLALLVLSLQYSDIGKILCPMNEVDSLLDISHEKIKLPFSYLSVDPNLSIKEKECLNIMIKNWIEEYRFIISTR